MPGRGDLIKEFRSEEYRNEYVEAFLDSALAAQIKALREARNLTQTQLATLIGTKQSGVSKLENVNYSKWSMSTLKSLARALDVSLSVKFVSFGEALADIENFSKRALVKPSFAQDPTFLNVKSRVPMEATTPIIRVTITPGTNSTTQSQDQLSTPADGHQERIRFTHKNRNCYTTPLSQPIGG